MFKLPGCLVTLITIVAASNADAGPKVSIVVGGNPSKLESRAGNELKSQFEQLFDATVSVGQSADDGADAAVLIGSPESNRAIDRALGDEWPDLSDQGFIIRSIENSKQIVVGGNSPAATFWAACELGHQFGVRYMLSGDALPANKPPMQLDDFDIRMEPALAQRAWQTMGAFPIGPSSWDFAQHKLVIEQLAKLKFNRLIINIFPWQPFVDYRFQGIAKKSAQLWHQPTFAIDSDTAGRKAFGSAAVFTNPVLIDAGNYRARVTAATNLVSRMIDAAHEVGMSVGLMTTADSFPLEFAPKHDATDSAGPTFVVNEDTFESGAANGLIAAKLQSLLRTYPKVDALYLRGSAGDSARLRWVSQLAAANASVDREQPVELVFTDADVELLPRMSAIVPTSASALHSIDATASRAAKRRSAIQLAANEAKISSLELNLAAETVIPQLASQSLSDLCTALKRHQWRGFAARHQTIGWLDLSTHIISRSAFGTDEPAETVYHELFGPICGKRAVVDRLVLGFKAYEDATALIDEHDLLFAMPMSDMVMRHYTSDGPPEWLAKAKELYTTAMIEMYRAHDNTDPRSRKYLFYYAKQGEFALEFLNAIDAVGNAGAAKKMGDLDDVIEQLEIAAEAIYNAATSVADIARTQSDRGIVAVLNEYGFKPLVAELERQAEAAP